MAERWYKPWHPTGLDEVRKTVDASADTLHGESNPPFQADPQSEARYSARQAQDTYEATERAREQGRQETLNKDQFREGWDAGQEAVKRQNAQRRQTQSTVRKITKARKPRMRSTSSIAKVSTRSASSAFRRRK